MLAADGLRSRTPVVFLAAEHDMPVSSWVYTKDEELGKRDDNYRPSQKAPQAWHHPLQWRRKRIAVLLAGTLLVWLFIHYIPTDLGSIDERMGRPLRPGHTVAESPSSSAIPNYNPRGAPPRSGEQGDGSKSEEEHYYAGPARFFMLSNSLRTIVRTGGHRNSNHNVLFAASSLKSAANLIPVACEMARWNRNFVHLALLGREAIPMQHLLEMNGVDKDACGVYFHDARPDYSEYSSEWRAEIAVAGAMTHINNYMHPQVIITDDSAVESAFFTRAMRGKAQEMGRPIIELPKGKYDHFMWMTRLDCASLASWHKPTIDILIHAPPDSSGSLLRLIQSLTEAEYAGLPMPRLTIDLPARLPPFLKDHLRFFEWPSRSEQDLDYHSKLNLHHRIPTTKPNTDVNAVRFLESFYPSNPDDTHIFLLSSQAEVAPLFYHFLFYHVLEHGYSASAMTDSSSLFGISLVTPPTHLNGAEPFKGPQVEDMALARYKKLAGTERGQQPAPFLWEAPNSDAALIFGHKWIEMHDFLSNRLRAARSPHTRDKLVSELQPGWMEYLLELVRARGWNMLYPAQGNAEHWVTVHGDLFQMPEEFQRPAGKPAKADVDDDDEQALEHVSSEPFLRGEASPAAGLVVDDKAVLPRSQPLHSLLPFDGDLPELAHLPLLSFDGVRIEAEESSELVHDFSAAFRRDVGGCSATEAKKSRKVFAGKTDDLFCFEDVEPVYEDEDEERAAVEAIMGEMAELVPTVSTSAAVRVAKDTGELATGSVKAAELGA